MMARPVGMTEPAETVAAFPFEARPEEETDLAGELENLENLFATGQPHVRSMICSFCGVGYST